MSTLEGNFSENEDDPQVYESSGDEWSSSSEKKRTNRRASQRLSKKPRITHVESSDSESDNPKSKTRNGVKRQRVANFKSASSANKRIFNNTVQSLPDFSNGSFLILKKDVQTGDTSKHPCIWRIDGKALLQKYEPLEEDGKVRYHNTSIYTGWSALDKDLYAPVQVTICHQSNQQMVVELNFEKLKAIALDSD